MIRSRCCLAFLAVVVAAPGCKTTRPFDRTTEPGGQPLPTTTAGAVILTEAELTAEPGMTILDAIRRAMPQAQVAGYSQNHCPLVELRGKDRLSGSSDPDVYVDGTRALDTCPLVTLDAAAAGRIEIYPSGVTPRPGYPSMGHGLILIFLQRADSTGGGR